MSTFSDKELIDISMAGSNNSFIVFHKIPSLPFFLKTIQFPDITLGETIVHRPKQVDWVVTSVKTTISSITLMYYLDEYFFNYLYLLQWLRDCRESDLLKEQMTDASMLVLNNAKQPLLRYTIRDAWINNLGTLDMDTQSTDVQNSYFSLNCSEFYWEYIMPGLKIPEGLSKTGRF